MCKTFLHLKCPWPFIICSKLPVPYTAFWGNSICGVLCHVLNVRHLDYLPSVAATGACAECHWGSVPCYSFHFSGNICPVAMELGNTGLSRPQRTHLDEQYRGGVSHILVLINMCLWAGLPVPPAPCIRGLGRQYALRLCVLLVHAEDSFP